MLAQKEYEDATYQKQVAQANFSVAQRKLARMQQGKHIIRATTAGLVVELPLQKGQAVTQYDSQSNEKSTVAKIAHMDNLLFHAKVSEIDSRYLQKGMQLVAWLTTFPEQKWAIEITQIALKADPETEKKGNVKFNLVGKVHIPYPLAITLRVGYTAMASLCLAQATQVLAIPEQYLYTADDTALVWVYEQGKKVKRKVTPGISDGLYTEIKAGLTLTDQLIRNDDSH